MEPVRWLNEALNVDLTLVDLRQRHCASFSEMMKPHEADTAPKYRGEVVKAALKSGWFVSPALEPDDVENLKASSVRWMAEQIAEAFSRAMEIDPKQ